MFNCDNNQYFDNELSLILTTLTILTILKNLKNLIILEILLVITNNDKLFLKY
jgi:hypothetical protein